MPVGTNVFSKLQMCSLYYYVLVQASISKAFETLCLLAQMCSLTYKCVLYATMYYVQAFVTLCLSAASAGSLHPPGFPYSAPSPLVVM